MDEKIEFVSLKQFASSEDFKKLLEASSLGDASASLKIANICAYNAGWQIDEDGVYLPDSQNKRPNDVSREWELEAIKYFEEAQKQGSRQAFESLHYYYLERNQINNAMLSFLRYVEKNDDQDSLFAELPWVCLTGRFTTLGERALSYYTKGLEIILGRHKKGNELDCIRIGFNSTLKALSLKDARTFLAVFFSEKEKWYKLSACIGRFYLENSLDEEGVKWLLVGNKHNISEADEILGDYYSGKFSPDKKNFNLATFYYQKANSLGNVSATISYIELLAKIDKNFYANAISSLLNELESNISKRPFYQSYFRDRISLASVCLDIGRTEDAFKIYKKGYKTGDYLSALNYACCLRDRVGTAQNVEEAINVFEELSEQNRFLPLSLSSTSKEAKFVDFEGRYYREFSRIYRTNDYSHFNTKKALQLLKKGAIHSDPDLECMYYYGDLLIFSGDKEEGVKWKAKALEQGYEPVINKQNTFQVKQIDINKIVEEKINQILLELHFSAKTLDSINDKVDSIGYKIDSFSDSVSLIKKNSSSLLLKLDEDSEAYEKKISAIQDQILDFVSREKVGNAEETTRNLEKSFGENWAKLTPESQNYLVSAETIFKALCAQDESKTLDYSSVCLMLCKAIEVELKRRFFTDFVTYLDGIYNKLYGCYHTQLTQEDRLSLKIDEKITLGDIPYILCCSKTKQAFGKYYQRNLEQILDFSNEAVFKENVNQAYLDGLSDQITKIRKDYRNPSCHTNPVSFITAKECFDYVLDSTKFLIEFLDKCKY